MNAPGNRALHPSAAASTRAAVAQSPLAQCPNLVMTASRGQRKSRRQTHSTFFLILFSHLHTEIGNYNVCINRPLAAGAVRSRARWVMEPVVEPVACLIYLWEEVCKSTLISYGVWNLSDGNLYPNSMSLILSILLNIVFIFIQFR